MEPSIEGALALTHSATGPLSQHLTAYVSSLIEQGYSTISVRTKAWPRSRLRWLAGPRGNSARQRHR